MKNNTETSFGPLHLFEFGGPTWVRAESEEDARRRLEDNQRGDGELTLVQEWPDDKPFTMTYYERDSIPTGLEADEKCTCDPNTLEEFGCECEAYTPNVTMPAGFWANDKGTDWVFGAYEG